MVDVQPRVNLSHSSFECVDALRLPLVNRFYGECNYRVKCGRFESTYSLSISGKIIAAARLIPQQAGHFLLRNVCVHPAWRQQGVASFFIRRLMEELHPADCYCYALPHLQSFYLRLQFVHLSPEQVPSDIREMYLRHRQRKRGWILMGYLQAQDVQQSVAINS